MVTDRGQEGCNIVTAWVLVSARLRTQLPHPARVTPTRIASPVIARSGIRRSPGWRSAIAFGGAAIIDDPDERAAGRGQVNG
jgi:nitroimidazol reductase NimA-like FMN-containing flavoprotein (pyridoxamine 5'-phosphate oxidase superfamily)